MAQRDTDISPRDLDAQRGRADRLRTRWTRVHIDYVEAVPCATGRRVSAVVQLGDLAPADVLVGLAPAETTGTAACSPDRRMWSCESLDNGRVVFERVIPPDEHAAGGDWIVCVRPAEELIGRAVQYRLRLDAPGAGVGDRAGDPRG